MALTNTSISHTAPAYSAGPAHCRSEPWAQSVASGMAEAVNVNRAPVGASMDRRIGSVRLSCGPLAVRATLAGLIRKKALLSCALCPSDAGPVPPRTASEEVVGVNTIWSMVLPRSARSTSISWMWRHPCDCATRSFTVSRLPAVRLP